MEQRGFILIADITGYTAYLNESELVHAQGTLTDLLELLIDHTRSPLVISRLEGDAVISYGLEDGFLSGQTFLETIETTYNDFRKAIELMVLNNTCRCNACANVSALDLKFFVHYGSFVLQQLGDHQELLGTDVNLIHRLLKNSVTEATGIRAYLLCTEAAVEALGIDSSDRMVRHVEQVPDFGETVVWVTDMTPLYEAWAAQDRIVIDSSEAVGGVNSVDIGLPKALVWDYLADPGFRRFILADDRMDLLDRQGGRVAAGSSYMCYHGDKVLPQVVLEWDPFDRMVVEQALDGTNTVLIDMLLSPIEGGTRLTTIAARPTGGLLLKVLLRVNGFNVRRQLKQFRDAVEGDHEHRQETGPSLQLDPAAVAATAAGAVAGWSAAADD